MVAAASGNSCSNGAGVVLMVCRGLHHVLLVFRFALTETTPYAREENALIIHGLFLRPANFLLQSGAILRDALQMVLVAITSIRDAVQ
jgi:hypothetical protein